jgi:hypothetical protein
LLLLCTFHQIKFVFNLFFREGKMMHLMNQFVATGFGLQIYAHYLTWSESHSNISKLVLHDAQAQSNSIQKTQRCLNDIKEAKTSAMASQQTCNDGREMASVDAGGDLLGGGPTAEAGRASPSPRPAPEPHRRPPSVAAGNLSIRENVSRAYVRTNQIPVTIFQG